MGGNPRRLRGRRDDPSCIRHGRLHGRVGADGRIETIGSTKLDRIHKGIRIARGIPGGGIHIDGACSVQMDGSSMRGGRRVLGSFSSLGGLQSLAIFHERGFRNERATAPTKKRSGGGMQGALVRR